MLDSGESRKEVIRPDFNRAIMIDFQGATISSDVGFLLVREIDERFIIIGPMGDCLEDLQSPAHTKHALVQMVRQRVYQIAAGYEDCNDAHHHSRQDKIRRHNPRRDWYESLCRPIDQEQVEQEPSPVNRSN